MYQRRLGTFGLDTTHSRLAVEERIVQYARGIDGGFALKVEGEMNWGSASAPVLVQLILVPTSELLGVLRTPPGSTPYSPTINTSHSDAIRNPQPPYLWWRRAVCAEVYVTI
jgi:hypothetical protein